MSQNIAATSLTQLSSCLEASTEVLISPEGLNQQFNQAAVQFLQHLLTKLLNRKLTSPMPISSPYTFVFKRIRILDSTVFQLPDPFSFVYSGAAGCSHTAGVKIQLEYGLLSGRYKFMKDRQAFYCLNIQEFNGISHLANRFLDMTMPESIRKGATKMYLLVKN
ncbi:hypothetical protein IE3_05478 [Bacillus cereus BAG3X2-1]|nr:hypothetical protein IE3_05478 [Bacillus cereus BAG3X2-1]